MALNSVDDRDLAQTQRLCVVLMDDALRQLKARRIACPRHPLCSRLRPGAQGTRAEGYQGSRRETGGMRRVARRALAHIRRRDGRPRTALQAEGYKTETIMVIFDMRNFRRASQDLRPRRL